MVAVDEFTISEVLRNLVLTGGLVAENAAGGHGFRVVVATSRPTLRSFFYALRREARDPVVVNDIPLALHAIAEQADIIEAAHIAIVDTSPDPIEALEVCEQLLALKPRLPIAAMFCCQRSATAADLRALAGVGVRSFLNEGELSEEEILRILREVSRGRGVLRLQMTEEAQTLVFNGPAGKPVVPALSADDRQLLQQITLGLTDAEIGSQMFLSRHTVKKRIERLRRRAEARNRVQLAAWASRLPALAENTSGERSRLNI
jgi:DNA-binding NarL/FixJ family response regulator